MRYLLLLSFLIVTYTSFSQDSLRMPADSQQRADIWARSIHRRDSLDSVDRARDIERNISTIVSWQQERNKKEKKQAITRIVIGLALLGVLIFSFIRRRKGKK